MKRPGFSHDLRAELNGLLPEHKARINRPGSLGSDGLARLAATPSPPSRAISVERPDARCLTDHSDITASDEATGAAAIAKGHVAFAVIAGTQGPADKDLGLGISWLAWVLMLGGGMPTWVMVPPAMLEAYHEHVKSLVVGPGTRGCFFEQLEACCLAPDNRLSFLGHQLPELRPTGSGDLGPALVEAGVLDEHPDVKHVVVCDGGNLLGCPHSGIVGWHVRHGSRATFEVTDGRASDHSDRFAAVDGHARFIDPLQASAAFESQPYHVATGNAVIDVSALRTSVTWRWERLRSYDGDRVVSYYQRSFLQLAEAPSTRFLVVPREQRYLPTGDEEQLAEARRVLAVHRIR